MVGMGFRRIALAQGLLNSGFPLSVNPALGSAQTHSPHGFDPPQRDSDVGPPGPDHQCANSTDNSRIHFAC